MSLLEQYEATLSQPSLLERVEESLVQSGLKEKVYQDYLAQNRLHQTEALSAMNTAQKGQVIIPTGTGKTRIQIALLVGDMIEKTKAGSLGTYVIGSHRLLLNKQLMDEYRDLCIRCGLQINVLYVGSARYDDKEVYDKYFSEGITGYKSAYTTSGSEIRSFSEKTLAEDRHLVIVSTYHSFDKLQSLESIDVCTFDEAHNTTQEVFQDNIVQVTPIIKRSFFFTATRKVCSIPGRGMENEEVYGDVLCEIGPRKMIDAGEMVRPRVLAMMLDTDTPTGVISNDNQHMLVKTIMEGFDRHKKELKNSSVEPDKIGAKLLVSFVGSDELALVQDSKDFQEWCKSQNIKVFSFSSRFGSLSDFEQEANRNKVYEEMRDLKDEEDCILLHIDILAEGINLPSITGVLLLRHLNEIKLFQTLGRALRLMKEDRKGLYSGDFSSQELSKFIKPYAYLILPLHFQKMDTSSEEMKETIQKVISTYGIPMEEFLPPEDFKARDTKSLDPITDRRKISKTEKAYPLKALIEDFILETFQKSLPEDPQEKYNTLMAMLKEEGDFNA